MRSKCCVGRGQEAPSLTATCAVGYVIAQESVAKPVETTNLIWLVVCGNNERKRTAAHLNEAGLNEIRKAVAVHLMPLHRGFEAARVGKSTARKSRIRQLPDHPI